MPRSYITSKDCLYLCQEGNKRFQAGKIHYQDLHVLRAELANSQNPHTAILSCADSRVPLEIIFDQSIGDLFVVRSAGNTAFPEAIASLEYAVQYLKVSLILIMGHTNCGAVSAALNKTDLPREAVALKKLIQQIHVGSHDAHDLTRAVQSNAQHTANKLLHESQIIHNAVKENRVGLHTAVYDIASGEVQFDESSRQILHGNLYQAKNPVESEAL